MKVVLVCIAKDEDSYIEEWLSYYKKLGFDEIVMYQNDWECKLDLPYLKKLTLNGPHKQMEAYSHFTANFRDDYDWAAFFDCDEFLVLKKHKNIHEFISEYNNDFGIGVNWQFFGPNNQMDCGEHKNSLIKQFVKKQKDVDQHIKTILNLKCGGVMTLPHNPNTTLMSTDGKFFNGPFNKDGNNDVAQLNHYHHKSYEDWVKRCNRGQSDRTPTKTPETWFDGKFDFCDVEDYDAIKFLYDSEI